MFIQTLEYTEEQWFSPFFFYLSTVHVILWTSKRRKIDGAGWATAKPYSCLLYSGNI
jgi:hypothetical protein